MTFFDLLLLSLAALYLAEVLTSKAGPGDMFIRFRERVPLGGMTSCIWCAAPWIALVLLLVYVFVPFGTYFVQVFSVAGAALALRSYTGVQHG